jgi:hypothetical protein
LTQQGEPTVADQNEAPKLPKLPELPGLLALLGPAANTKVREMIFAYAAQAVHEERERCAQAIEARLSALDSAQSQLGADEYGARCCVEGRKQQVKADAAAIRSQPMPGADLSADDAGGEK